MIIKNNNKVFYSRGYLICIIAHMGTYIMYLCVYALRRKRNISSYWGMYNNNNNNVERRVNYGVGSDASRHQFESWPRATALSGHATVLNRETTMPLPPHAPTGHGRNLRMPNMKFCQNQTHVMLTKPTVPQNIIAVLDNTAMPKEVQF